MLKELAEEISEPLATIFEKSGSIGLEEGKCCPYFQKGEERSPQQLPPSQFNTGAGKGFGTSHSTGSV